MVYFGGHRPFQLIHHFVFKKDHGVVIANSALKETFGIVWSGGHSDLQSGNMTYPGVKGSGYVAQPIGVSRRGLSAGPWVH